MVQLSSWKDSYGSFARDPLFDLLVDIARARAPSSVSRTPRGTNNPCVTESGKECRPWEWSRGGGKSGDISPATPVEERAGSLGVEFCRSGPVPVVGPAYGWVEGTGGAEEKQGGEKTSKIIGARDFLINGR